MDTGMGGGMSGGMSRPSGDMAPPDNSDMSAPSDTDTVAPPDRNGGMGGKGAWTAEDVISLPSLHRPHRQNKSA